MNDDDDLILEGFARLLDGASDIAVVRSVYQGGGTGAIWNAIRDSGYVDALLSEHDGGFGLSRAHVTSLLVAAGRRLLPVAFGHTVVARFLIAEAGEVLSVDGPIVLWPTNAEGRLRSQVAPAVFEAGHALVQGGSSFRLLPLKPRGEQDGFGFQQSAPDLDAAPLLSYSMDTCCLLEWGAVLSALTSAGAMARVLDMTLHHVTERQQFGRALGGFQAIQHMAALAAEQSVIATTAVRIAFSGTGSAIDGTRVAMAKLLTGMAATEVSRIAHALHGAIGISAEHDLQLYTRQLKRLQLSYGAQDYWANRIGAARIAAPGGTTVDFIRDRLVPQPA